jgi:hypothetical protein
MQLIDDNITSANFIGFIVGELYTKFLAKEEGKHLPNGLVAIIEKLLNSDFDKSAYNNISKKDIELLETLSFSKHDKLFQLASEFIH